MAFNPTNLQRYSPLTESGPALYGYITKDTVSTVSQTKYFTPFGGGVNQSLLTCALSVGDTIICTCSDGGLYVDVSNINPIQTLPNLVSGSLTPNSVSTATFQNLAVTGPKIAAGAVTTAKLANAGVANNNFAADSVLTASIADNAVGTTEIDDGVIGVTQLAANSVTATQLAANSVTTTILANNAVGTADLAANAVTGTSIGSATIAAGNFVNNTLTATQIANNTITGALFQNHSLTSVSFDPNLMTRAVTVLTDAQIRSLASSPIIIGPATGGALNFLCYVFYLNYGGTPFVGGGDIHMRWKLGAVLNDMAFVILGTNFTSLTQSTLIELPYFNIGTFGDYSDINGADIVLSANGNFTGGTGSTLTVYGIYKNNS